MRSRGFSRLRRAAGTATALARSTVGSGDLAVFHEFAPPPGGGGNQFLRALMGELERTGLQVAENRVARSTRAVLCNSYQFDRRRLALVRRPSLRVVHRVDGPIGVYRGHDDGTDRAIWQANHDLADATVFQSRYSLERHRGLGLEFREPTVIMNAVDPSLFHPGRRRPGRRLRLVSTSWSDNPAKGADVIRWLEQRLDHDRYEFTFVGRSPVQFEHVTMVPPVPPAELARILREHDVFFTASLHESCSNALLEALACGLPALYVDSGSNAEVAGEGGLAFREREELPGLVDRLADELAERRTRISIPALSHVADRYREVLGL